ncbi:MAG: bile acid:sodium symporter family protein [Saprospiraceae bacterium]|nr:bile acid:sodium symporter family protein [Saprospiraceae bacterium]
MESLIHKLLFPVAIILIVVFAMVFPQWLIQWGNFSLKQLIIPLLMLIMFGMGTSMSIQDFRRVLKMPYAVFIGLLCQFTIMPFVGWTIASLFGFPPAVAAGIILVGCSPSGLASNVMSYIAKANLALSLTLTACATLLAPFLTPFLMSYLAGELVPIDVWKMMWSIIKMVILPIILGLLWNHLVEQKTALLRPILPIISMSGIVLIIGIITAAGRESLLQIGFLLILGCFLHNLIGYFLGYSICRLLKLDRPSCRTIAFEVGMQNSGLASGIALELGKVASMGLASIIFGPTMNITGSLLASFWRDKNFKP